MISMLRKEARSGNIQDLAHVPTQNFLADCLTKADNLIIAVETGRLLEVDVHPNFRTLMEHKALLSTLCRTFMHTREKEVFFLSALRIPLAPTPQKKIISDDVCGELSITRIKRNSIRVSGRVRRLRKLRLPSQIHALNFLEILMRMLCPCLTLMNLSFSAASRYSNIVTMAVVKPRCVESEGYYYEALAFSRHRINLELDEESMKPAKATKAPRNAGINPSTMKIRNGTRDMIA